MLWALRARLVVYRHELRVCHLGVDVRTLRAARGIRAPGTAFPGLATIGTFRRRGARSFWLVGRAPAVTVLECDGPHERVLHEMSPAERSKLGDVMTAWHIPCPPAATA